MDPEENLKIQLKCAGSDPKDFENSFCRLSEHVLALDDWLVKGGFLPPRWAEKCNGGLVAQAELAKEIYELFEVKGSYGLIYLLGSILTGGKGVELHPLDDYDELEFLKQCLPEGHRAWQYITIIKE